MACWMAVRTLFTRLSPADANLGRASPESTRGRYSQQRERSGSSAWATEKVNGDCRRDVMQWLAVC